MSVTLLNHILDTETPTYGDRDRFEITPNSSISEGDTANSLIWNFSTNHIGTHIDVPRHFYEDGTTITDLDPGRWIFDSVCVIDIPCNSPKLISIDDLQEADIDPDVDLLIIRTGYEQFRQSDTYWKEYPGIDSEACRWLRDEFPDLCGVGFDFISLTSPQFKDQGKKAHQVLLDEEAGDFVLIIEDMRLAHLDFIPEQVIISPLIVNNADGSPVTVFAF